MSLVEMKKILVEELPINLDLFKQQCEVIRGWNQYTGKSGSEKSVRMDALGLYRNLVSDAKTAADIEEIARYWLGRIPKKTRRRSSKLCPNGKRSGIRKI